MKQRTSRGSKALKPVERLFVSARRRITARNGKRAKVLERGHGSLEREGPEGRSLGVPAG